MSLANPSPYAQPVTCPNCGRQIALPRREEALLDERGWAHVACVCGLAATIPFEVVEPESSRAKRRPSWVAAVVWIVIIGLVALLLPMFQMVQREPEPPQPPSYMTT